MLLFKKKFLDQIRNGTKTQTIRLLEHCRFRSGQRSYIPGAGYIQIDLVEQVSLDDLTDADAAPDGFETADLLRKEIKSLYCEKLQNGCSAYKIVFHLFPPEEQERMIEERKGKTPAKKRRNRKNKKELQRFDATMQKLNEMAQPPK